MIKECVNCKQEKEHHAKGLCYTCYKKLRFKPKEIKCKRCCRVLPLHAKGFCAGCYNYTFHLDKNRAYHHRKADNIDLKTYRKTTKECAICGFTTLVDIHHLDQNKKNNSTNNLIGLCPNHHRMIHNSKYRDGLISALKNKEFTAPPSNLPKNPTPDPLSASNSRSQALP